jgi:uncharacterized membrane protein
MSKSLALKIILVIAIIGVLFSGYLSYGELTRGACPLEGCTGHIFGLPVCVYGLVMYIAVLIVSLLGLRAKDVPINS